MGSWKNAALFILLIIVISTSLSNCDEIQEQIKGLVDRVKKLEDQNGKKQQQINVLKASHAQLIYQVASLTTKLSEFHGNVSEKLNEVKTSTNNLVQNEIGNISEKLTDFEEFSILLNMPQSCGQLKYLGVSKSKKLLVDPDGSGENNAPIEVKDFFLFFIIAKKYVSWYA